MSVLSTLVNRMAANPWLYEQVRNVLGERQTQQRVKAHLAGTDQKVVLDIGAGTGIFRSLLSDTARYVWVDYETTKVSSFHCRRTGRRRKAQRTDFVPPTELGRSRLATAGLIDSD